MTTSKSNEVYRNLLQEQIRKNIKDSKEMQDFDIEQTLIEDRIMYDKLKLANAGIEFDSKEFFLWKEGNKKLFFPALDAPWEVRKAWREHKERMSKVGGENHNNLKTLERQMCLNINKINGLFFGIRLKDFTDYSHLINLAINTYNEIYNRTKNSIFREYASLLSI